MFDYFSKPKKSNFGFVDYDSFILCKPGKDYKINSNINIIKGEVPILYDIGLNRSMFYLIENALKSIGKKAEFLIIFISHYHPDHVLNLCFLKYYFPNSIIIWHEKAYENLITFSKNKEKIINLYNKRVERFVSNSWLLFISSIVRKVNQNFICKDNDLLPSYDLELKVIHTPGHSEGHSCLLDCTNKVLFLGDHVPLTPWLDISKDAIDNIISSIKKLLKLSSKEVEVSVRGHGNLKDNWREVYPWEEEKKRFEEYLDLIETSIDRTLYYLKIRALTIEELANIILKNKDFREYSSFLNRIFMPPNLSWVICYLLKLMKEHKVEQIGKKFKAT